jgi:hypothetical protein
VAASEWGLNKDHVYETLFKDHFTTAARDSRRLAMRGKISSVNALAPSTSRSSTAVHALAPSTTVRDIPFTDDQQTLPEWGGGGGGGGSEMDIGGAPGFGGGEGGKGGEEGGREGGRLWGKHRESMLVVSHIIGAVSPPKP